MGSAFNFDISGGIRSSEFVNLRRPWFVGILFAILMAAQALGFVLLGTGRWGSGLSQAIIVLNGMLAMACAWIAFRRAQGVAALFWFLFTIVLVVLGVPTAVQAYDTLFGQTLLSESTRSLLYALYGAPILMMLFLPETYRRARLNCEIFLDLFQVAIVVGLIYSTFFFLPARQMLPADALMRDVSITDAQSLLLLLAALVRLQFARVGSTRNLLLRLALFLLVCAIVTFIGDWIYLQFSSGGEWFDLGWSIPMVVAGLIAVSWTPSTVPETAVEPAHFAGFLGTNLVLVAMLSCMALLADRWKQAYGETLTNIAIAGSLLAFTLRLALTQFHQQQEITRRKTAQKQLAASHLKIGRLLDSAQRQTAEISQISELGSLLQACTSREEVFRLIPERLRRLFPGASGCISLFSVSRKRVESAAEWGAGFPSGQFFSPEQCWALRRGRAHAHAGGPSSLRCSHLRGEGPSVCIPVISSGEAVGILSVQNDDAISSISDGDPDSEDFGRRRQLASTVAEQLAVALANLDLRESLRVQAVRDPLTGLYNRRYMQEFLERELHSARRKRRPLAVMMLDLDHFKRYNDNFGHSAGDQALAAVGETLLRSVRLEDVACRYGGEEFALILPECSLRQATVRAEELRKRLSEYRARVNDSSTSPLTVSIGLAAFDETTDRVDLLLKFADDALYQAKRAGRDRVVVAQPAAALPEVGLGEADPLTSSGVASG
jgi:diguanylate cyclase (GGDEF)-like protein